MGAGEPMSVSPSTQSREKGPPLKLSDLKKAIPSLFGVFCNQIILPLCSGPFGCPYLVLHGKHLHSPALSYLIRPVHCGPSSLLLHRLLIIGHECHGDVSVGDIVQDKCNAGKWWDKRSLKPPPSSPSSPSSSSSPSKDEERERKKRKNPKTSIRLVPALLSFEVEKTKLSQTRT